MARPRTFDPTEALDAAMHLFWRQGYEATSVDDLVHATGVNRYSLYTQWGDKHGLYLAAVEHYGVSVGGAWLVALTASADPLLGIEALFQSLCDAIEADDQRRGCFAMNTILELGARDPEVQSAVRRALDSVQDAFAATLERARASGQLSEGADISSHARHLAVCMQALLLQARAAPPPETLRAFVQITLSTLPRAHP